MIRNPLMFPIMYLFARNPCKKCIVRACCTNICEEKSYYKNFYEDRSTNDKCIIALMLFAYAMCFYLVYQMIITIIAP
jgi:sulfatase maturation enzyme AslB (radical SAM superfamily)